MGVTLRWFGTVFVAVILATICRRSMSQMPSPLTGAAFTATRIQQVTGVNPNTTTGVMARRSDGSTYLELKSGDGIHGEILIMDIAQHRAVVLYLDSHSYVVHPLPDLKAQTRPQDYYEQFMKLSGAVGSKRVLDNGLQITDLGRKMVEGFETVGFAETTANGRTVEEWYLPALDLDLAKKTHNPEKGVDSETSIQQIRVGEPDAKLFEIPVGYTQDKANAASVGVVAR